MAWEELLRKHDKKKDTQTFPAGGDALKKTGLIRQVCELVGQSGTESAAVPEEEEIPAQQAICPDGYVRRSPVQPYCTAEGYHLRRIRKAVMTVVGIVFVGLLIYALMKSGLLIFRLR